MTTFGNLYCYISQLHQGTTRGILYEHDMGDPSKRVWWHGQRGPYIRADVECPSRGCLQKRVEMNLSHRVIRMTWRKYRTAEELFRVSSSHAKLKNPEILEMLLEMNR